MKYTNACTALEEMFLTHFARTGDCRPETLRTMAHNFVLQNCSTPSAVQTLAATRPQPLALAGDLASCQAQVVQELTEVVAILVMGKIK